MDRDDLEARSVVNSSVAACSFYLSGIVDSRLNQLQLSPAFDGKELFSEGLVDHFAAMLDQSGFFVESGPRAKQVELEIMKAYVQHKSTSIVSQFVLVAELEAQERIVIRGQVTSGNWFSAKTEYVGALTKAIDRAIDKLFSTLNSRCV